MIWCTSKLQCDPHGMEAKMRNPLIRGIPPDIGHHQCAIYQTDAFVVTLSNLEGVCCHQMCIGGWFSLMMAGIYGYIMLLWSWGSKAKAKAIKRQVVGLHQLLAISCSGSDEDSSTECPLLLLPDLTRIARVRGTASPACSAESLACPWQDSWFTLATSLRSHATDKCCLQASGATITFQRVCLWVLLVAYKMEMFLRKLQLVLTFEEHWC